MLHTIYAPRLNEFTSVCFTAIYSTLVLIQRCYWK